MPKATRTTVPNKNFFIVSLQLSSLRLTLKRLKFGRDRCDDLTRASNLSELKRKSRLRNATLASEVNRPEVNDLLGLSRICVGTFCHRNSAIFPPAHCRPAALRVTPAMAAGVTKRLWQMTDLVEMLEAWEESGKLVS
jgi:hypothetical protein